MTLDGKLLKWASWFPPDLDPEHPPLLEYVTDQDGVEWCFWYDPHEAFRWVNFGPEYCTFIEGDDELVGQPLHLLDYQLGPTREMFGWKVVDLSTGQPTDIRRYQSADIWMPKGNSKTTWGAVLDLAACKLDNHHQAQCFYMCATEDQAEDSGWRILQALVKADAGRLKDEYVPWEMSIDHSPTNSTLHLLASGSKPQGKAGKNVHFAHADEIFEFPTLRGVNQLLTAMAKQKNPFLLATSTAGIDTTMPAYKLYLNDYAILKGEKIDVRHLPLIYAAPEGSDPHDKKVWAIANPGFGITVNEGTLSRIYEKMRDDPNDFAEFMAFHLGMWQSGSQEFITDAQWHLARRDYKAEDLYGLVWFLGVDLAATTDMCSIAGCALVPASRCCPEQVAAGKVKASDVHKCLMPYYWVPEITAREKSANAEKYLRWIAEGHLFRTDTQTVDYRAIRDYGAQVIAVNAMVYQAGFDRRFAHNCIYDWRDGEDLKHRIWKTAPKPNDPPRLVEINQGEAGMGNALKEFRRAIIAGELHHNGHPILDWNRANARVIRTRSGLDLLSKAKSTGKIDGLHAASQAFYLADNAGPIAPSESIYARRGVVKF